MATEALQFVPDENTAQQNDSIEQSVVDDWLVIDNKGERLCFVGGDGMLVLADTEYHSKQQIREFDAELRPLLESMMHEGLERLRQKISEEEATEAAAMPNKAVEEAVTKITAQRGYVVVDKTWDRALFYSKDSKCLWEANATKPVTFFTTPEEALDAIRNTKNYGDGQYAWSTNDYVVLRIN